MSEEQNIAVAISYFVLICFIGLAFIDLVIIPKAKKYIEARFPLLFWEHGTCNNKKAKRHKYKGSVQFVLWKAGEQGHDEDYWYDFDESHWPNFNPHNKQ